VRFAGVHTGGKGVQAADAVGKALFFKEIQRAIGDRGLVAETFGGKAGQHIIGPQGAVGFEQDFKGAAAHRRQAQAFGSDQGIGADKRVGGAMGVIMLREGQIGRIATGAGCGMKVGHVRLLTCYSITYITAFMLPRKRVSMRYIISSILAMAALPAYADAPRVVTDIPPVQALVAQVMGDLGAPALLLEKGADEHDFQLRPSQMQSIVDADLVVWIGPELTPWLDRALVSAGHGAGLALLDAPQTKLLAFAEADHEEASHEHDGTDPHAWMDPANAAAWVGLIASELARLDPEHSADYAANATATQARIAAMDADIAAKLAPINSRPFVTFHAAYGYFTAHYGLQAAASLALGDATVPGAAKLAALQAQMQAGAFVCAFPEIQHDPALLSQLIDGSGVKLGAALDPVGSSLEFGPGAYDALMRGIAGALVDCLRRP
jgi:zinc transport system substrate-binding protein